MQNNKLRKRLICVIAMSYAWNPENLWAVYGNIGDIEKLLNLLENNKLASK